MQSSVTPSGGFQAKLPDLSGLRRLRMVSVRSILIFRKMNRSLCHHRYSLRKMWEMLVQMLRTTSPRLEGIDLHFKPYNYTRLRKCSHSCPAGYLPFIDQPSRCCGHIALNIKMTTPLLLFGSTPTSPRPIMYTNPHSYSLPQELTGMVMSNLARDLPSLSTASLVSKSWSVESSRFLFRDLAVTKPPRMDHSLLEFLKTSERVRQNVRALHLAPAGGSPGMFKRPEDFQGFAFDKLL